MTVLEISVLDTCTIFEGPDTLFRYDLPGTGIVEGWATETVVQQAEELLGTWEAGDIQLSGEAQALEVLQQAFEAAGAQLAPKRQATTPQPARRKPFAPARRKQPNRTPAKKLVWGSIVAVAVLTGVVSWRWLTAHPPAPSEPNESSEPMETATVASKSNKHPTEPPKSPPPPSVRTMELGGLRVALPVDFGLEQRGEDVMARGEDPNLRVLLSTSVSGYSIAGTLASIEEDASLELLHHHPRGQAPQVVYLEHAEDGSETRWTQWAQGDTTYFVGCQTKAKATHEQLAVCDQAVQSLEKAEKNFPESLGT